jgi:hypothetical protein
MSLFSNLGTNFSQYVICRCTLYTSTFFDKGHLQPLHRSIHITICHKYELKVTSNITAHVTCLPSMPGEQITLPLSYPIRNYDFTDS